MDDSEQPDRPGLDADATEIAEWMEEDFGRAVAEGMENASDEDESPFDCDPEALTDLPVHDVEQD